MGGRPCPRSRASVSQAQAVSYTGTIEIIEMWRSGNVAFRLHGVSSSCASNNWLVLNKSADGTKNMYAALLAAKMSGKQVRVWSPGCGPAEGYGSTPYLQVDYLNLIDQPARPRDQFSTFAPGCWGAWSSRPFHG